MRGHECLLCTRTAYHETAGRNPEMLLIGPLQNVGSSRVFRSQAVSFESLSAMKLWNMDTPTANPSGIAIAATWTSIRSQFLRGPQRSAATPHQGAATTQREYIRPSLGAASP